MSESDISHLALARTTLAARRAIVLGPTLDSELCFVLHVGFLRCFTAFSSGAINRRFTRSPCSMPWGAPLPLFPPTSKRRRLRERSAPLVPRGGEVGKLEASGPRPPPSAPWTNEPFGPAEDEQVLAASVVAGEPLLHVHQSPGIVLAHRPAHYRWGQVESSNYPFSSNP